MQLKTVERFIRRTSIRAIAGLMGQSAKGERPDWRARPYRVLFLRHDRIGDMIVSTGILRAIAQAFPETVKLDVLASKTNAVVLKHEPYIHEVIPFDKKRTNDYPAALRALRRRRYDAVIDCMVTFPSLTTLLLMLASGARYRIGVAQGNDFAYTLAVPPRDTHTHIIDKLGALAAAFGLDPSALDLRPRVKLTGEELERGERVWRGDGARTGRQGPRLLVNISAGRGHHYWPDDRFIAVIRAVRAEIPNAEIVVVSSPSDRARAAAIAAEGGARLVQDEGIRDAMSIVARADMVFTPDTSIAHVCSAFDKPAVILHPRGGPAIWGPYETEGRAIESETDAVMGITADEAARALLARFASRSAR
jgi:ADP-heptose:LPS heptosyltransferase